MKNIWFWIPIYGLIKGLNLSLDEVIELQLDELDALTLVLYNIIFISLIFCKFLLI